MSTTTLVALLGLVAATCSTGSWLPQVLRTIRTGSTADFSWAYLTLFGTGVTCWAAYGVLRDDIAVAAANILTLALFLGVVWTKWATRRDDAQGAVAPAERPRPLEDAA